MTAAYAIWEQRSRETDVEKPGTLGHRAKILVEGKIIKRGAPSEIAVVLDRQVVPVVQSLVEPSW